MFSKCRIIAVFTIFYMILKPAGVAGEDQSQVQSVLPKEFRNYFDPSHDSGLMGSPQSEHPPLQGIVKEHTDAKDYTYMKVDTGGNLIWVAAYKIEVAIGDTVEFLPNIKMEKFHSKTLNRDFDEIYFVEEFSIKSSNPSKISDAKQKNRTQSGTSQTPKSLSDLISNRQSFAGKAARVQGTVVKVNANILNRNWIHLVDQTLSKESFVVTSTENVEVGDKITAEGLIFIDKDVGGGYVFPVIMEDANISKTAGSKDNK